MSGTALTDALNRLNSCRDAADIIYSSEAANSSSLSTGLRQASVNAVPASQASPAADAYSLLLARRIGTMVARLNELTSPASQVVLTPRLALCELMDIVRQALYTSLPAEMQQPAPASDKAAVVRQFNAYASSRQVPIDAAVEGLYVVSYVSVKLRVELAALQLRRRIQEELASKEAQKSEASVAALVVTQTLLDDFLTVYNNIVLTVPITKAAGREGSAEEAAKRLAPVFPQYYYQLCDWVLVLESTMNAPAITYTQVKRVSLDEQHGTVVVELHRPTPETPWGLLLNEQGALVDIDVSLRVFEKARELHQLLQSTPQGATIIKIKDTAIASVRNSDYAAYTRHLLQALHEATAGRKNVQLTLRSSAFKAATRTLPTEVAFLAPPQGGERTSGQRVTLVLRRQSTAADWGFIVSDQLYWQPPSLRILSDAAKEFMRAYGRHLRLLAVNGVEALHMAQVQLLVEAAETVVLELLVMPKYARTRLAAAQAATAPLPPSPATRAPPTVTAAAPPSSFPPASASSRTAVQAVEPALKLLLSTLDQTATQSAVDDGRMESAMNQYRQQQTVPSAGAAAAAAAPASGAAPTAVARSVESAPRIAMETPLVAAAAVSPSASAAAATIAATQAPKTGARRGHPPKALKEAAAAGGGAAAASQSLAGSAASGAAPTQLGENAGPTVASDATAVGAGQEMPYSPQKAKRGRPPKALKEAMAAAAAAAAAPRAAAEGEKTAEAETAVPARAETTAAVTASCQEAGAVTSSVEDGAGSKEAATKAAAAVEAAEEAAEEKTDGACVFDNEVRLVELSEEAMVLERPSVDVPWGLPIGRLAAPELAPQQLPLRLMSLPMGRKRRARLHPLFVDFKKQPRTWYIAQVNELPATDAEATLKHIGKLTRMTLRFVRK